jgi:hypothetical protein
VIGPRPSRLTVKREDVARSPAHRIMLGAPPVHEYAEHKEPDSRNGRDQHPYDDLQVGLPALVLPNATRVTCAPPL